MSISGFYSKKKLISRFHATKKRHSRFHENLLGSPRLVRRVTNFYLASLAVSSMSHSDGVSYVDCHMFT